MLLCLLKDDGGHYSISVEGFINRFTGSVMRFNNKIGLPSVACCAGELHLSASYFEDLIKKESGKTAQEYIQEKIIDVAKGKIFDETKSVGQIAYESGF